MSASLGRPPVELNLVPQDGLAEPLLADPLTEQPVAGFSGIFKTQIPKESLNFWFKSFGIMLQKGESEPGNKLSPGILGHQNLLAFFKNDYFHLATSVDFRFDRWGFPQPVRAQDQLL